MANDKPLTREFKIRLTVLVDDATKYDEQMERYCAIVLDDLRTIHRNYDRGSGLTKLEIERVGCDG